MMSRRRGLDAKSFALLLVCAPLAFLAYLQIDGSEDPNIGSLEWSLVLGYTATVGGVAFVAAWLGLHPLVVPVILVGVCVAYIVWQWTWIDCLDCYSDGIKIRTIRGWMTEATAWAAVYFGALSLAAGLLGKSLRRRS